MDERWSEVKVECKLKRGANMENIPQLILNLIGLVMITLGSIGAALCAPTPKYNPDGSVEVSGEPDKNKRIAIYRRQTWFPRCLYIIGGGAFIQSIALFLSR